MRFWVFALLLACDRTPDSPADAGAEAEAPFDAADETSETSIGDVTEEPPPPIPGRVRIMSANLTSGTQQSYEDPGIRIFQGLQPDVVVIQEFKYPAGLRAFVDAAFGTTFSFYVEPTGNIPNGIVSRYPIIDAGSWVDASVSDRGFAWARIAAPGTIELFAVSLHLLTTSETVRDTEAKQLIGYIQANAPPADYLLIGGDLNTESATEAAMIDLSALVMTTGPYPMDQNGNTNSSMNRNRPHDWVLGGISLHSRAAPVAIGFSSYPSGLVFDSRVYTPLSEVAPVMMTDSGATGMQHMAVVRDFVFDK